MTIIILLVVLVVLFSLAFISKRRFGVLGLSLAAGVVLAQNATSQVANLYQNFDLPVAPLSFDTAATVTLIILPALILLISGPTYSNKRSALIGSIGFALLGMFFLAGPLTASLPPAEPLVRDTLLTISQWENLIVVVSLALALVDTFMVHGASIPRRKSKK